MSSPVVTSSDEVTRRLAPHAGRLRALGVTSLSLFGSVARGEARHSSDLDVLVEFAGPAGFDRYMELKLFLEDLLGRRVDLLTTRALRPELRPYIERDLIRVA